jgi:hypothetical protein
MAKHTKLGMAVLGGALAVAIFCAVELNEGRNEQQKRSATEQEAANATYVNVRFAYSVCYPPQLLVSQGEAPDSDGERFVSKDNKFIAIVYGSNNVLKQSLEQIFAQNSHQFLGKALSVTDREMVNESFTFSGISGGNVVLEKTFLRGDVIKTVDIEYPQAANRIYETIARRILACFKNTD